MKIFIIGATGGYWDLPDQAIDPEQARAALLGQGDWQVAIVL